MIIVDKTPVTKKFLRSIAESDLYPISREMGYSLKTIDNFQKNRITQSVALGLALLVGGSLLSSWFYFLAVVFSFVFYKSKYKSLKSKHSVWKFQRHLQFSKFTRLLIPYLKQNEGKASLYTIFNKILQRTENEQDKKMLYTLMSEMSSKPNNIKPFIDYANKSSGTDMSVLFMSTIFDFQQSTFDTSVIDELGKMASEELLDGINQIIKFKLHRFSSFPTKITMTVMIIILGFAVAMIVANIPSF